ncbi:MAG: hypothetical protein VXW32_10605 [Myxococcota bacterium]|nr:hypothetical protein [Myxococcota bacterium]
MTRHLFILALGSMTLACKADTDPVEDTGEATEDTGEATEDTGEGIDDAQGPSPEAFENLQIEALADEIQLFSVSADLPIEIVGEHGTLLSLAPHQLRTSSGEMVSGTVEIELIEAFDRGTMLAIDMPSQGRNALGEIAQLISGGEHYVNATQNGEDLALDGAFMLQVNAETTGGPDSEMGLFRPDPVDGAWIEQEADPEAFGIGRMPGADGKGTVDTYWLTSGEFGWTNIDKWYNDPRPKTEIHVQVPAGHDPDNCGVYLAYAGEGSALARFDTWDAATNRFGEHYGLIPIGLEVHVIFVTESEGLWSYAIQSETITEDHLTLFDASEPLSTGTMDELSAAINALP